MPKDDDKSDATPGHKQGLSSEEETLWDELMGDVAPLERKNTSTGNGLKKDTGKDTKKDTVVEDFADADASDPQTPPDMSYFEAFIEGKINLADIPQKQQPQNVIHQTQPENSPPPSAATPSLTAGKPEPTFIITENSAHKLAGYRAGLDGKTFKNLARGRVNPSLDVDLHGMTLMAAYAELRVFLAHSRAEGHKCVLIIHGKGRRDGREMGTIKQNLAGFLAERPEVRAFHTAHPRHGGSGACYVLIRRG